jgi:cephalosporin-C deacetylase
MHLIDKQLEALNSIDVPLTRRPDFQIFWKEALAKVKRVPLNIKMRRIETAFPGIEAFDLTFEGLDGTDVNAWFLLPVQAKEGKVPCVVRYHGSSGSRGVPADHAAWLLTGSAVLAMDHRMQGGRTGSNTGFTGGPAYDEFIFGIEDKSKYYFYHAVTDALRAVETVLQQDNIDHGRIAVEGGSQGGGASLIVSALHPSISLCLADVPSFSYMEKRLFDKTGAANVIAELIKRHPEMLDTVCETLSYFDNINHAENIKCPVLVSVGLKDNVCTPDTVFASYNRIRSPKRISVYPFGEHGGGGAVHFEVKLSFLKEHFFSR